MILLYYTAVPQHGEPDLSQLPPQIAERIAGRPKANRRQSAAAWQLLVRALGECGLDMRTISLHFSENGRPSLPSHPHLTFSLTHTDTLAAIALCNNGDMIGLDAEPIEETARTARIAARFFTQAEKESGQPPTLIWTRKEALLKSLDLTALPDTAHTDAHFTTFIRDGHYLTLCTAKQQDITLIPIRTP
ncbi:MAG: 4'-phosphopantetheinyl transferase superfamily protein [Clostridia bacterium]|nr:4'-phosphopantetheinyl transferase superfamily protein [Clostridia bacterium]